MAYTIITAWVYIMNVFKGTVSKLVILTASGTKMMTLPSEDVKLYQVRECMILKSKYLSIYTHTLSLFRMH